MDVRLASLMRLAKRPTVFHFGKYKGKRMLTVYHSDMKYIGWCLDQNIPGVAESLTGVQRRAAEFAFHEFDDVEDQWYDEMYNDIQWGD